MFEAKFAPIASPSVIRRFAQIGIQQNYMFLLVHEVSKHPYEYRELVRDVCAKFHTVDIIVDNGVIERGEPWEVEEIFATVEEIKCRGAKFCIPHRDWLREDLRTCDAAHEDVPKIVRAKHIPLVIPQGATLNQVTYSMTRIGDLCPSYRWGIPRWMADEFETRADLVRIIRTYWPMAGIHLLGFSNNFFDDMACCHLPGVVGIDSAMPVWFEHDLRQGGPPPQMKRPKDFFEWVGAPHPASRNCRYVWQMVTGGNFARHYDNDGQGTGSAAAGDQPVEEASELRELPIQNADDLI
jgi:hypothetical protein